METNKKKVAKSAKTATSVKEKASDKILKAEVDKVKKTETAKPDVKKVDLSINPKNDIKYFHNPSTWSSHTDLIVKLDPPLNYIGNAGKVGRSMPRIDVEEIVYETTEEKSILTSEFKFGVIYSVPKYLEDRYKFGDRIYFIHHKLVDFDQRFALVPPHVNVGIAEAVKVVDVIDMKGNGSIKRDKSEGFTKRCSNTIRRFFQKFRLWLGSLNVSKR